MKQRFFAEKYVIATLPVVALLMLATACKDVGTSPATAKPAPPVAAPAAPSQAASADEGKALQDAVVTYVRDVKGLDTTKMDVALKNQTLNGEKAEATVEFKIKGSEMPPMTYVYSLEKSGDGWKVISSKPASGEGHGAMPSGTMPEGHPPVASHSSGTGAPDMASSH